MERVLNSSKNSDDVFGAPHTLFSKAQPALHVANLSAAPIVIGPGDVLGIGHNPCSWLARPKDVSKPALQAAQARVELVRKLSNYL